MADARFILLQNFCALAYKDAGEAVFTGMRFLI
jgi:hypothetical protein